MTRTRWPEVVGIWTVAILASAVSATTAWGGPKTGEKAPPAAAGTATASPTVPATATAEKPHATKKRRSGVQLPPYFAEVVDKEQRGKIYAIQEEYAGQIAAVKAQLATLVAERDQKIAAVLTEEQRSRIEAQKAEAKSKRSSAASGERPAKPVQAAAATK